MASDAPHCSIVVCTRNRAESLATTLRAVLSQDYDRERLELVVVDNGSTDGTASLVAECARGAPFPVRCVAEPRVGLSRARNRGVESARGSIVLFLDDDAWPAEPGWVRSLAAAYRDPRVAAAGGDLLPRWPEGGRPPWLPDGLLPSLGLTRFAHTRETPTHYPLYPWGANLSFRKQRIQELGGFSPRLGRRGSEPFSGEETELCLRLEQAGDRVVYVPDAEVVHDLRGKALGPGSLEHYARFQGVSEARIERAHFPPLRLAGAVARRLLLLALGAAGALALPRSLLPRLWLLCRFKARAAQGYLAELGDPATDE